MAQGRGRPRNFDSDEALEQVLGVFWQQGYLGTSYSDLCAKTGQSKPSLYAAFGNKEATFLAALELYIVLYVQPGIDVLNQEPDAREAIQKLLVAEVQGLTAKSQPLGCMIATNSACCDSQDIPQTVAQALRAAAALTRDAISARLGRAVGDAQLPAETGLEALTGFFDMIVAGLSSLARQGASEQELIKSANIAMSIWPKQPGQPVP